MASFIEAKFTEEALNNFDEDGIHDE